MRLARLHLEGVGVGRDSPRPPLFRKAGEAGEPAAWRELAYLHLNGDGVARTRCSPRPTCARRRAPADMDAQFASPACSLEGIGVAKSESRRRAGSARRRATAMSARRSNTRSSSSTGAGRPRTRRWRRAGCSEAASEGQSRGADSPRAAACRGQGRREGPGEAARLYLTARASGLQDEFLDDWLLGLDANVRRRRRRPPSDAGRRARLAPALPGASAAASAAPPARRRRWTAPRVEAIWTSARRGLAAGRFRVSVSSSRFGAGFMRPRRSSPVRARSSRPGLEESSQREVLRAGRRPGQQCRSGAEGAQEEDAARGHLPRDEASRPLREAVRAQGAREGGGRAPGPQACPQARPARGPAADQEARHRRARTQRSGNFAANLSHALPASDRPPSCDGRLLGRATDGAEECVAMLPVRHLFPPRLLRCRARRRPRRLRERGTAGQPAPSMPETASEANITSLERGDRARPSDPTATTCAAPPTAGPGAIARRWPISIAALALDPPLQPAYANRALVHRRQEKFNEALQDYSRAIQADPNYAAAYVGRGTHLSAERPTRPRARRLQRRRQARADGRAGLPQSRPRPIRRGPAPARDRGLHRRRSACRRARPSLTTAAA